MIEFFGSKGFHAPGFTIRNAVVVPLLIPPGVPHTATDLLGFLIETPRQETACLEILHLAPHEILRRAYRRKIDLEHERRRQGNAWSARRRRRTSETDPFLE